MYKVNMDHWKKLYDELAIKFYEKEREVSSFTKQIE